MEQQHMDTALAFPLEKMTVPEKISTMEILWDDLCRTPSNIVSPEWHKEVLDEREKSVNDGLDVFVDWEEAKKNIMKATM